MPHVSDRFYPACPVYPIKSAYPLFNWGTRVRQIIAVHGGLRYQRCYRFWPWAEIGKGSIRYQCQPWGSLGFALKEHRLRATKHPSRSL